MLSSLFWCCVLLVPVLLHLLVALVSVCVRVRLSVNGLILKPISVLITSPKYNTCHQDFPLVTESRFQGPPKPQRNKYKAAAALCGVPHEGGAPWVSAHAHMHSRMDV